MDKPVHSINKAQDRFRNHLSIHLHHIISTPRPDSNNSRATSIHLPERHNSSTNPIPPVCLLEPLERPLHTYPTNLNSLQTSRPLRKLHLQSHHLLEACRPLPGFLCVHPLALLQSMLSRCNSYTMGNSHRDHQGLLLSPLLLQLYRMVTDIRLRRLPTSHWRLR
jgi:hypothetical protein